MLEHCVCMYIYIYRKTKYIIFPFISIFSSLLYFLKLSFILGVLYYCYQRCCYQRYYQRCCSRDEQSLATLQVRTQPNHVLLDKDTFHPHTGTLSTKTNLFPQSQVYCFLSPAPASTLDGPNLSEHDRILCPKAIYQYLVGSFMHVKCQLSCIFTFFLQKVKDHEKTL